MWRYNKNQSEMDFFNQDLKKNNIPAFNSKSLGLAFLLLSGWYLGETTLVTPILGNNEITTSMTWAFVHSLRVVPKVHTIALPSINDDFGQHSLPVQRASNGKAKQQDLKQITERNAFEVH